MNARSPERVHWWLVVSAASLLLVAGLAAAPLGARPEAAPGGGSWTVAPDAPFAFTRFDAEYSLETGLVYFLGGRLADANTDGSIWSFNPATGVYTDTGLDMPVPISNYDIARLHDGAGDEVLVVFGGRPAAGGVVNTVQGYKPGSNTVVDYTATDPYPVLTSPGGVAVVDNVAYVFGGFDAVQVIANTYFFDLTAPAGSRFTAGPDLGLARSYTGAAVVDGVIYAVGGDAFDGVSLLPQSIVERLDTANPTAWDDAGAADLPLPCDEMRSFGFDSDSAYDLAGKLVVAGCGQWPNELPESLLYDVATNTWDQAFPDLNQVRRNHAGAFAPVGDPAGPWAMWVWGGRQGSDAFLLYTPEYYEVLEVLPSLEVNKTVSADGSCSDSSTLEVPPGTEVTYCYTMINTGPFDLLSHTVDDDQLGLITGGPFTVTVAPGESISVTAVATLTESVTNTVTWTATAEGGGSASNTATASVTVGTAALSVAKTVSTDGSCGTATSLSVEPGTEVTYCYTMTNDGDLDLLVHTVEDDQLGLITGGAITQTVAPGATASVTATAVITESVTNIVTWTAWTSGGQMASATASATVNVGAPYWLYLPVIVNLATPGGRAAP